MIENSMQIQERLELQVKLQKEKIAKTTLD